MEDLRSREGWRAKENRKMLRGSPWKTPVEMWYLSPLEAVVDDKGKKIVEIGDKARVGEVLKVSYWIP